jgi:amino acid adenylation domain-containing protein
MSFGRLIHRRFAAVAATAGERIALCTPAGDTTYAELRNGIAAVACLLAEAGIDADARVAIVAADHATVVTALLATLEAGGIFAPLDSASGPRLARLLEAIRPTAIIVDANGRSRLPADVAVPMIELTGAQPTKQPRGTRTPAPHIDPDAACCIYFTSGSTGAPRAILGRLSGIDHHIEWELDFLGHVAAQRGTILHTSSYDAYLPDVLVPLCAGGTAYAPPSTEPNELCAWLARQRITLIHCVPSQFRAWTASPLLTESRPCAVLFAGEVVRASDVHAARSAWGPAVRVVNLYGPSEATLVKLHHEITTADLACDAIPIGRPMPDVRVHVLDDDLQPVPTGELGQLAIESAHAALGYLDEPALTAQRWLSAGWSAAPQPAIAPDIRTGIEVNEGLESKGSITSSTLQAVHAGQLGQEVSSRRTTLYLTGDVGRVLPDGTLAFNGRRDRQIKLLGARVDLDEVEAIVSACDGVREAAVVVAEGESVLHGFVVLARGFSIDDVRRALADRLSPAMRLAWLTPLTQMPRTESGKLDRRRMLADATEQT